MLKNIEIWALTLTLTLATALSACSSSDETGRIGAAHTVADAGQVKQDGGPPPVDAGPQGCTLTQGYWRNHPWPTSTLDIGGTTYTRAELIAYIGGGGGNACRILGQQLIAALLNVESGASPIAAIAEAEAAWDAYCTPLGTVVHPSSTEGQILIAYSEILTDYNEGRLGPGRCPPNCPPGGCGP